MANYEDKSREELIARLEQLEDTTHSHSDTREELEDSKERLRAILETAVEGIITIDPRGIIGQFNTAAEKLFGYARQEVLGKTINMLMPSPYREEHDMYLERYCRTGHAKIIGIGREVVGLRKDGSVFPMYLSVGEVRLADGRFFTGIVRDITAQKTAETKLAELAQTLAEKNKELETIVYVASHDLRSPLVNIQGFSKELAQTCATLKDQLAHILNDEQRQKVMPLLNQDVPEALEYIQSGVVKIDRLLAGFLRFSRLGRAALRMEQLDMEALVREILKSMEFQLKQAGARVTVHALPHAIGDAVQINQVFSNLFDNALKYAEPGRPLELEVSGSLEGKRAAFIVSDNGMGIPKEHQHKVFEIFHRLNPSKSQGEGLGLTIAQRILERHSGKITVESEPGVGSRFYVTLPARR